jgi:hypothetical protein
MKNAPQARYTTYATHYTHTKDAAVDRGVTHLVLRVTDAADGQPSSALTELRATLYEREKLRDRFLDVVDGRPHGAHRFGEVLDTSGFVRKWVVESDDWKGTGCWGWELGEGLLIHLTSLSYASPVSATV